MSFEHRNTWAYSNISKNRVLDRGSCNTECIPNHIKSSVNIHTYKYMNVLMATSRLTCYSQQFPKSLSFTRLQNQQCPHTAGASTSKQKTEITIFYAADSAGCRLSRAH